MTTFSEATGHRTVTHASIERFASLTGDDARMHLDHDFGQASGMGGTIAHGLLSGAWALGALAQHAPERLGIGDPHAYVAGQAVRFHRSLFVGDLFSLRWAPGDDAAIEGLAEDGRFDSRFEVVNQRDEVVTSGSVSVASAGDTDPGARGPALPPPPPLFEPTPARTDPRPAVLYAEDLVEYGPRGVCGGRTVTETDLVQWAQATGEANPLYGNAVFAAASRFGARIAPPMWTFCVAFGDFLRELLRVPMPSTGFAGHMGDAWRFVAPVHVGDTLTTRHAPVEVRPSKSRPEMGLVTFAIQVVNQREEVVQDGRVIMMIGRRDAVVPDAQP